MPVVHVFGVLGTASASACIFVLRLDRRVTIFGVSTPAGISVLPTFSNFHLSVRYADVAAPKFQDAVVSKPSKRLYSPFQ